MKPLPEIGKEYHFFDDGKVGPGRHYVCKVERIIKLEESKGIDVVTPVCNELTNEDDKCIRTLFDVYQENVDDRGWTYAEETDYMIEASCPTYDINNLWFVREKDGGWFSINIQNWWQSGRLDVDGSIYKGIIEEYTKEGNAEIIEFYESATYDRKPTIGS